MKLHYFKFTKYIITFLFFCFSKSLFAMEEICQKIIFDEFAYTEYGENTNDFGFYIIDAEPTEDRLYFDFIYNESPAFDAGIRQYDDLIAIDGIEIFKNSYGNFEETRDKIIEELNSKESINLKYLVYDTGETKEVELSKNNYQLDPAVTNNIYLDSFEVKEKSKKTDAVFYLYSYWDNQKVINFIREKYNVQDFFCFINEPENINEILNKFWIPIPSTEVRGATLEPKRIRYISIDSSGLFAMELFLNYQIWNGTNFTLFPFDRLNAEFEFQYPDGGDIYLENFEENEKKDIETINDMIYEWKLVENSTEFDTEKYADSDTVFQMTKYIIELRREYWYYILKIVMPVIFIVLISFSVFWIKNQELEAKLNVSIVSLLALIAYNFVYNSEIPKVSSLTIMDTIVLISYLFAGLATAVSVYSYYDYRKDSIEGDFNPIDKKLRYLAPIAYFLSIGSGIAAVWKLA